VDEVFTGLGGNEDMMLCKECKWSAYELVSLLMGVPGRYSCTHPQVVSGAPEVLVGMEFSIPCVEVRTGNQVVKGESNPCGKEGRLWEPNDD